MLWLWQLLSFQHNFQKSDEFFYTILESKPINPSINLEFDVSNACSFCLRTCQQVTNQSRNPIFRQTCSRSQFRAHIWYLAVFFLFRTCQQISHQSNSQMFQVCCSCMRTLSVFACEYGHVSRPSSEYVSFVLWVLASPGLSCDYHGCPIFNDFLVLRRPPTVRSFINITNSRRRERGDSVWKGFGNMFEGVLECVCVSVPCRIQMLFHVCSESLLV